MARGLFPQLAIIFVKEPVLKAEESPKGVSYVL